jgi:hypothetical protein
MIERKLLQTYTKPELIALANVLNVDVTGVGSKSILSMIMSDISANGVPHEEDCDDLMSEFLTTAGFINEHGEVVERKSEIVTISEKPVKELDTDKVKFIEPPCFGIADERAPECKKCKVFDLCVVRRSELQPPCFGEEFDETDDECKKCIDNNRCRKAMNGGKK